ncbi:MAG: response regulator [Gammaproteobacteria bacterium]|nr:response regulator [Gammaproteobacteria bacterium]
MQKLAIVDDEPEILDILRRFLTSGEKYQVTTYADPVRALPEIIASNTDLVLLDIMMPGMDGIDFLAQMKREKPGIKIIMITAHSTLDRVLKSHKNSADDFVTKPIDLADLQRRISNILEK